MKLGYTTLGLLHKRFIEKITFEVNKVLQKRFLQNFEYHPETIPLESNPSLGGGNGHAQSRDLNLLVPHLIYLRAMRCRSILDLGSGDGYVLRVANSLGFATLGVEADFSLHQIASRNVPRAKLFNMYFQDLKPEEFLNRVDVLFFFNSDNYKVMKDAVVSLNGINYRYLLTKNFVFTRQDAQELNILLRFRFQSYSLYRAKSFRRV